MKTLAGIVLPVLFVTGGIWSMQAQDRMEFYEISSGIEDSSYVIRYWVRFEGLIEFTVRDKYGKKVWFHSAVRKQGEYGVQLYLAKFAPGRYKYNFRYKNKDYSGEFEVPRQEPSIYDYD
ncbi:MAG: hypothetical protein KF690_05565 [Bacteroidetes bacterium]|nr:hypothetical protein [Bacteroidota bacterium]